MHALSARHLLEVWESGFSQAPAEQALALLAAARPDVSRDALAALSIGARDASLLNLREGLWGPEMIAVVACSSCRETLELSLDTRELLSGHQREQTEELSASLDGYKIAFRVPTSFDVIAASRHYDPEQGRALILDRCLLSVEKGETSVTSGDLSPEVLAAVEERMTEADPLADIQLDLTCPSCEGRWQAVFDIVSFLWTELDVWARRMLRDVHILARAYGWSEMDVLALSPTRRQFYLDMAGA